MRSPVLVQRFVLVAVATAVLISGCRVSESGQRAPRTPVAKAHDVVLTAATLRDTQGLQGGANVYLDAHRHYVVQVVRPANTGETGLQESRYLGEIDAEHWSRIVDAAASADWFGLVIKERAGKPDEARPSIALTTGDGRRQVIAKWGSDSNPRFDAVLKELRALVDVAVATQPVYQGPLDAAWEPQGFDAGAVK